MKIFLWYKNFETSLNSQLFNFKDQCTMQYRMQLRCKLSCNKMGRRKQKVCHVQKRWLVSGWKYLKHCQCTCWRYNYMFKHMPRYVQRRTTYEIFWKILKLINWIRLKNSIKFYRCEGARFLRHHIRFEARDTRDIGNRYRRKISGLNLTWK